MITKPATLITNVSSSNKTHKISNSNECGRYRFGIGIARLAGKDALNRLVDRFIESPSFLEKSSVLAKAAFHPASISPVWTSFKLTLRKKYNEIIIS